jgi:hypothetical protein
MSSLNLKGEILPSLDISLDVSPEGLQQAGDLFMNEDVPIFIPLSLSLEKTMI